MNNSKEEWMKHLILVLIILCCSWTAFAQQTVRGTLVDDKTGKGIDGASISLLKDNRAIVSFAISDTKGTFTLATKPEGAFISISCIGYASKLIPWGEVKTDQVYRLVGKTYEIKEVKIVSERIQANKDTLTYSVAGFRMKQDRSIADVIRKMPGLSISSSGQITFEDKAINKLYIEGMDLMGNRYALATNNLSGKVVKQVQVLRNHQPIAAIRGKAFSEQAALNLVLEDDVRYTLSGCADLGVGYSAKKEMLWDARILGMLLGRKQQNLTLYKTNNNGVDVSQEISVQTFNQELGEISDYPLIDRINLSVPKIDQSRYLDNKSHLLAFNHLYKFNKVTTLRSQLTFLHVDRQMEESTSSSYFYPEGTVRIGEQKELSGKSDQYGLELEFLKNDAENYIRNRLVSNFDRDRGAGLFQTNGSPINSAQQIRAKELINYFQLIKTYNDKHILKFYSTNSYREMPQRLTVTPGLYADLLNGGQSYEGFSQEVFLRTFGSGNFVQSQLKVAGFYVNLKAGVDYTNQQLATDLFLEKEQRLFPTSQERFINAFRWVDTKLHATPSLTYKDETWNIGVYFPASYHRYSQNDHEQIGGCTTFNRFFIEPRLSIRFEASALWAFHTAINYQYMVPTINELFSGYVFRNYRNAFSGNGFYNNRLLSSSLGVTFSQPLVGFFWSLNGSFTPIWKDKMFRTKTEGVLTSVELVDKKHRNTNWSLRTKVSKGFGWWKLFTEFTAGYNENRMKTILSDQLVPYTSRNGWMNLNLALQPCKYFSFEGSQNYARSTLKSSIMKGYSSESYRTSLSLNAFPNDHWKMKWNHLWMVSRKPISSSIYFMDAATSYLFKKVEIELSMNNILNKKTFSQTVYSSVSEQTTLNYFRPREVMAKLYITF
ncbi:MAG: hypothetical protein EOM31_08120 [Bacteroidia bacterium]|nr:hypothetical protein [Bacteroidia bacterium]